MSIIEGLRRFVDGVVRPREEALQQILDDPHRLWGADRRLHPDVLAARREIRLAAADAGYYQMFAPQSLGGGGLDNVTLYAVWHDLYRRRGMQGWLSFDSVTHWATGPSHLVEAMTDATRGDYLDAIMSGAMTLCFALSESDAGSDVWRIRARATRTATGWLLNGEKQWITNGPYADAAMVFAVTDPEAVAARRGGISGFFVPMSTPGASVAQVLRLFGHASSNESTMVFQDVELPSHALIGEEGEGLALALSGTSIGRIYNSARSIGLAAWALEQAVDYATQRVAFNKPIIEHQGIGFALAECASDTLAAHLLGLHAARTLDLAAPATAEGAIAKSRSTETAVRVIDRVVQVLGGMGITNETHLSQAWQEIRAVCIADGSAEMMRRLIAHQLAAGRVRF